MNRYKTIIDAEPFVQIPQVIYHHDNNAKVGIEEVAAAMSMITLRNKFQVVVLDSTNFNTPAIDPISSLQARDIVKARLLEGEPVIVLREPRGAILWKDTVLLTKYGITLGGRKFLWGITDEEIQKQFPEGMWGIMCNVYYEASKLRALFSEKTCDNYVVTYHSESGQTGRVYFWGCI